MLGELHPTNKIKYKQMKWLSFISAFVFLFIFSPVQLLFSQSNMFIDNYQAKQILKGNYEPEKFVSANNASTAELLVSELVHNASKENIYELLVFLDTFHNRNTGSDTLSLHTGIGACRAWIKSYFDLISRENENRMITGYLEFDASICGTSHHKNPFGILPGTDTSKHEILVIEGHFDTRNSDACDTQGYTPGSDDNGSGTVLVMEAARILAKYSFERTILFTTPTGEDQGLWGAKAWANYLDANNIEVLACLNNDVVGGIYCGNTSSPPSCPYPGHIDSTHVRVFSYVAGNSTSRNSPHKQLARLIKLIQDEQVNQFLETRMTINIMASEDRSGRSGDHIPFRQKGFPSIRFCSANENGNGAGNYPDRQHSTRDLLGDDIDGDGILDTLYVDPGYLRRNVIINTTVLANLANSSELTDYNFAPRPQGVNIRIESHDPLIEGYMVGIRQKSSRSHEFDEVQFHPAGDVLSVDLKNSERYYVSVSSIKNGFQSSFSDEYEVNLVSHDMLDFKEGIRMSPISPNPWDNETSITIDFSGISNTQLLQLNIMDLTGRLVYSKVIKGENGEVNVPLNGDGFDPGVYLVFLSSDGTRSNYQKMVKK